MFKDAVGNGSHLFMELTHVQTLTCQKRENGWVSREQWQTLSGFQEDRHDGPREQGQSIQAFLIWEVPSTQHSKKYMLIE